MSLATSEDYRRKRKEKEKKATGKKQTGSDYLLDTIRIKGCIYHCRHLAGRYV